MSATKINQLILQKKNLTRIHGLTNFLLKNSKQIRCFSSTLRKHDAFSPLDTFSHRHNGSTNSEIKEMLDFVGVKDMDEFISNTIPANILIKEPLALNGEGFTESELLKRLKSIASKNKIYKSYIGMGYSDTIVPPVILRNILESPAWYTQVSDLQLLFVIWKVQPERIFVQRNDFHRFAVKHSTIRNAMNNMGLIVIVHDLRRILLAVYSISTGDFARFEFTYEPCIFGFFPLISLFTLLPSGICDLNLKNINRSLRIFIKLSNHGY